MLNSGIAISVLMTAYNAEKTISAAIESALIQSFPDFELIIINDGSTDKTERIVSSFDDNRIRLINNPSNLGIVASRNIGLSLCRGKYICILDADDICHKDRFLRQYRFMESNPDYVVCGSHYRNLINGRISFSFKDYLYAVSDEEIRVTMLRTCPIGNPTVIMRRSIVNEYRLQYEPEYPLAEDYAFWNRISKYGKFHIINRPLLIYRRHDNQVTSQRADLVREGANRVRADIIKTLVPDIQPEEISIHLALMDKHNSKEGISLERVDAWIDKVCSINRENAVYNVQLLQKMFAKCRRNFIKYSRRANYQ